jgi:DnaJ homolog subfamily C member 13
MSGTAVDNILQRLRTHREERQGLNNQQGDTTSRFLVTKLSWRGNYRRILAITSTAVITYHPESLAVTNAWAFAGDHDIAAIEVGGGGNAESSSAEGSFTLHFRKDKKGIKSRDAKFSCKDRAGFLTALYDAIADAAARGISGAAPMLLGNNEVEIFQGFKLRKGEWIPIVLRITPTAVERLDRDSGVVKWRWVYAYAASPAVRLLSSSCSSSSSSSSAAAASFSSPSSPSPPPAGTQQFALLSKTGRSPRVYATRDRNNLLRAMQAAALKKVGITLAVDASVVESLSGPDLLSMVAAAERERAATPEEAPLGEWEVLRVHDPRDLPAMPAMVDPSSLLSTPPTAAAASSSTSSSLYGSFPPGIKAVVPRRLVLTSNGLLERRPATYEVAEWRQLPAVSALIRYADDPQWLGIEWSDGTPRSIYVTPARDALLAAVLYAVQAISGRPVPVLPAPTSSGDVLVALKNQPPGAPAVNVVEEVEKMFLTQLTTAANEFIAAGGVELSLNALALAGLTAATVGTVSGSGGGINSLQESTMSNSSSAATAAVSPTRDIAALEHRMREFNASIPYSGIATSK